MCHACLVAHEGGEVTWFGWVVLGERLHLSAVSLASLARQESEGSVARRRELSMRLKIENAHENGNERTPRGKSVSK